MAKIIGILGEKLAGKDTVADYIVKKYGADHVRTSHVLDDLLNVLGLPITRRNEIDAGRGMEMVFGQRVIGEAVKQRVLKSRAPLVVINGLRQLYQFKDAKELGAKIIYITAPAALRFERYQARQEKKEDGQGSFEEFVQQDEEWIEKEIPIQGKQADFTIENTGSREELYRKIDAIIEQIDV